ncbi:hypothetical protein KZ326_08920 [Glaesserella parasuis]|nr:hypothetical protein [Glaesserella parasuis]
MMNSEAIHHKIASIFYLFAQKGNNQGLNMMFSPTFLKEWFSLDEIAQFLKNQHRAEPPRKELLKQLVASNLVEFYFYLEGDGYDQGNVTIGRQKSDFLALSLADPAPYMDYAGSYQQLEDFLLQQEKTSIWIEGKETKIYLDFDDIERHFFPAFFCGMFTIPIETFNEINLLFSDEKSLYLPENAFYSSLELLDNPAQTNAVYNFNFLRMEFSHARGQGLLRLDDIRIYLPAYKMPEFIDYFKAKHPTAPAKTVKNKSNKKAENPTDKKTIITHFVLESVKATAEANKHCGGYQIINAVIEAMIEKQGYRKNDFLTPEAYLKKVKKAPYHLTFPKNSGRYKADQKPLINVILTA